MNFNLPTLDAEPTDSEKEVYEIVKGVLDESPKILEQLENYPGASAAIRQVSSLTSAVFNLSNSIALGCSWLPYISQFGCISRVVVHVVQSTSYYNTEDVRRCYFSLKLCFTST